MWNRSTKKRLRLALIETYRNYRLLEIFMMDEFEVRLTAISEEKSLTVVAFDVIDWAAASGRLDRLFAAFCTENPHHPICSELNAGLNAGSKESEVNGGRSGAASAEFKTTTPHPNHQPNTPTVVPPIVIPPAVVEVLPESLPQNVMCSVSIPWGLAQRGGMQPLKLSNGIQADVAIPRGAQSGQRVHVAGAGNNGGDLIVTLAVQPKPEPELVSVKGVNYSRLRELLRAGKWQAADEETAQRMLEVAGQDRWLYEKDIDHFPCEDLRTIDQLWVYFSDGKFGFSVQAKIYRELGGTREYDEQVWEKFCDRVGWRVGDNWLNYSDLTFNTSAPSAHLPVVVGWGCWWCGVRCAWISSLAQRLVDCNR